MLPLGGLFSLKGFKGGGGGALQKFLNIVLYDEQKTAETKTVCETISQKPFNMIRVHVPHTIHTSVFLPEES